MPLFDFNKSKSASSQQPPSESTKPPEPLNAKQKYAQDAAQMKAAEKPITPEIKAQADRAVATMEKATQHRHPEVQTAPDSGSNTAHLQKQNQQDKTQEALSPTDNAAGKTAVQGKDTAPEKPKEREEPTVARRAPSWER